MPPPLFPLCPLPVSRTVFSLSPPSCSSFAPLSLSRSHASPFISRAHSLRSSRYRRTSHSVSFSYYRSDLASSTATTAAVAARVSNRGRRGCLSYTGIRNTVIPRSPSPSPWPPPSPHHAASHRLQHPMPPAPSPSSHPSVVFPRHAVAFATEAEFNYFISPYTDQRHRCRRCRRRRRHRHYQPRAESDVSHRRLLAPSFLHPSSLCTPSRHRRRDRVPLLSFHPLLSRFTPLFLFRRIASVSARPFSPHVLFPPRCPSALGSRSVRHFAVALRASNFPERGDFITSHFLPAGAFPRPRVHPFFLHPLHTGFFHCAVKTQSVS